MTFVEGISREAVPAVTLIVTPITHARTARNRKYLPGNRLQAVECASRTEVCTISPSL
jgi:hypothetical protein